MNQIKVLLLIPFLMFSYINGMDTQIDLDLHDIENSANIELIPLPFWQCLKILATMEEKFLAASTLTRELDAHHEIKVDKELLERLNFENNNLKRALTELHNLQYNWSIFSENKKLLIMVISVILLSSGALLDLILEKPFIFCGSSLGILLISSTAFLLFFQKYNKKLIYITDLANSIHKMNIDLIEQNKIQHLNNSL